MALRNRPFSGRGRHPSFSLNQRTVCLDRKTRDDVIGIIHNLNNEQWETLTKNLDNITRVDFSRICVGIVQHLTDTIYKKSKLVNSSQECAAQGFRSSARPAFHPSVSPRESPVGNAAIAELALEGKLALSVALENMASGKVSLAATSEGWSALFLQLEEETLNILTASLDSSDFFARMAVASCPLGKDAQVDTEVKSTTDLAESPDKDATDSSCQQAEAAEATSDGVEEAVTSPKEEDITTACTNEVISQIFDAYKLANLEEERLMAAREREEEVSLLTSNLVDNVMIELKELASTGKTQAFQWVPRDVRLPAALAVCTAGQIVFSPQFEITAEEKVSEVLVLSECMTGEPPVGQVPSTATDIVASVVRSFSNLSPSSGSFRSAEDRVNMVSTAQNIYHNVQSKVRDFLWGMKPRKEDGDSQLTDSSLSYDTDSSCGTIMEEDDDDEEETSEEDESGEEDLHLALPKDSALLSRGQSKESKMKPPPEVTLSRSEGGSSSEQKTPRRKADLELDVRNINQYPGQTIPAPRTPQPAVHRPSVDRDAMRDYLRKLVCCIRTDDQVKDEGLSNVTQAETSTLPHISESQASDIIVIMQRERSSLEFLVESEPGSRADVELDPARASQRPEKTSPALRSTQPVDRLPHINRNTTGNHLRNLMCCLKADDQVEAEDMTEAETSSVHSKSESPMSDIILIMDREKESQEPQSV